MVDRNGDKIKRGLLLLVLVGVLADCSGPEPDEAGIIGFNLTFSVAFYSWLIISLASLVFRKIGRESMVIPQESLRRQLTAFMVLSTGLSFFLFSMDRYDIYWIFANTPVAEWFTLQIFSFMILPFIAAYVFLAYMITLVPPMRRYRPYNLTLAVAIHWLFCAHFFLVR